MVGRMAMDAIYEYRCVGLGLTGLRHVEEVLLPRDAAGSLVGSPCRTCGSPLRRKYSLSFASVPQEAFNPSLGIPISDAKQFERECRKASEKATAHTGIEHKYVPVDHDLGD